MFSLDQEQEIAKYRKELEQMKNTCKTEEDKELLESCFEKLVECYHSTEKNYGAIYEVSKDVKKALPTRLIQNEGQLYGYMSDISPYSKSDLKHSVEMGERIILYKDDPDTAYKMYDYDLSYFIKKYKNFLAVGPQSPGQTFISGIFIHSKTVYI